MVTSYLTAAKMYDYATKSAHTTKKSHTIQSPLTLSLTPLFLLFDLLGVVTM